MGPILDPIIPGIKHDRDKTNLFLMQKEGVNDIKWGDKYLFSGHVFNG